MLRCSIISYALFVAIYLIASSHAAAWTPGNLLVARIGDSALTGTNIVYVDEIKMDGTLVQSFTTYDCSMDNNPYRLAITYSPDKLSIAIACFLAPYATTAPAANTKKQIYQITHDGRMFLFGVVTGMDGLSPTAALVNGVDSDDGWIGGNDQFYAAYVSKGLDGAPTKPIFSSNAGATVGFQVLNDTFYTMYYDLFPYIVAVVTGGTAAAKSSTPTPVVPLFDAKAGVTPSMQTVLPNRAFVYSPTEIYGVGDTKEYALWKVYKDGAWKMYYLNVDGSSGYGVHAVDVDGIRMVYVTTALKSVFSVVDDGTALTNPTKIITYPNVLVTDVKYVYPTCFDSHTNQDETDVDCGGSICSLRCTDGKQCKINSDCTTEYCNPTGNCSVPSCNDGFANQDETDVDCGGNLCLQRCPDVKNCNLDSDCGSNYCYSGSCLTPTCADGIQNQGESDIDCGGPCSKCAIGKVCTNSTECLSGNCNDKGLCDATCSDGVQNLDETGIDCGGAKCPACSQSPDGSISPDGVNTPGSSNTPGASNTPGSGSNSPSGKTPGGNKVSTACQSVLAGFALLVAVFALLV